jgi:hypothetical protein
VLLPRSPSDNVVAFIKEGPVAIERVAPPGSDGPVAACDAARVLEREARCERSIWGAEGRLIFAHPRSVWRERRLLHACRDRIFIYHM